jgi:crooked neck
MKDLSRAEKVYEQALRIIPHQKFTFSKLWNMYSRFLIRRGQLDKARKVMGNALGINPKEKSYRDYITLELGLREFDRARRVYEKYISWRRGNPRAWLGYAELEIGLGELQRARGLFELAVVDCESPEVWKAYIDFEVENGEWEKARSLYDRLNELTGSVKVCKCNLGHDFES